MYLHMQYRLNTDCPTKWQLHGKDILRHKDSMNVSSSGVTKGIQKLATTLRGYHHISKLL